jgi:hypothetical protein
VEPAGIGRPGDPLATFLGDVPSTGTSGMGRLLRTGRTLWARAQSPTCNPSRRLGARPLTVRPLAALTRESVLWVRLASDH